MNFATRVKQEYPLLIEGTLRHQNNINIAKTKYGNTFNCIIVNTNYFDDETRTPTLVVSDDTSLVLGKPRYPENFTDDKYEIKLVDIHNAGLYSIEVSKYDNDTRKIIRQRLSKEIENMIDAKVNTWMESKQTNFNNDLTDKYTLFNIELIQYLNSLRDTSNIHRSFREQVESDYIDSRITYIMETIINLPSNHTNDIT